MSDLRAIIEGEILRRGPIPFARFMELALYCPNFGYYEQPNLSPGRRGDFYTSVSVGPLFGELLAFQFSSWRDEMEGPVQIVEAGAHEAALARDILSWLGGHRPDLARTTEYWFIEPSARRRQWQEATLAKAGGLAARWFDGFEALPPSGVRGIIFANELLDAMPVHRIGWDAAGRRWFEWGVTLPPSAAEPAPPNPGAVLAWTKLLWQPPPATEASLPELPPGLLDVLPDGFTTEICPAATRFWRQAARALRNGKLLTLDYGLTADEFFTPERRNGTLRAYHRHHASADLLSRIGAQDLTAQVNFSAIQTAGEAAGLRTEAFVSQARFLTPIMKGIIEAQPAFGEWTAGQTRQFQTLTHPEHLGRAFRVLVQARAA